MARLRSQRLEARLRGKKFGAAKLRPLGGSVGHPVAEPDVGWQGWRPNRSARGRGVSIMDAVMDHVHFTSEPESGSIVHLVKTLDLLPDGAMAASLGAAEAD